MKKENRACRFGLRAPYNEGMATLEILVPTAEVRSVSLALAPRLEQLDGKRIGWLDNLKANAGLLLREIANAVNQNGVEFERVVASKNATAAAAPSVMSHLETCDAVVLAIAD